MAEVLASGRPRGNPALLRAIDLLRSTPDLTFLWAPAGSPANWYRDQVSGLIATQPGPVSFDYGGAANPIANSSGGLSFTTNAGISGSGTPFLSIILVSVINPAAVTGSFLKIGNTASGIGVGAGSTSFDDIGSEQVMLRENLEWFASASTSTFTPGLNVLTWGQTNDGTFVSYNHTNDTFNNVNSATWVAASNNLYINGYSSTRGSNCTVHAVAIFKRSMNSTAFVNLRTALASYFAPFARTPGPVFKRAFAPERRVSYFFPSTIPTLSAATAVSIGSTTATPRVTLTF